MVCAVKKDRTRTDLMQGEKTVRQTAIPYGAVGQGGGSGKTSSGRLLHFLGFYVLQHKILDELQEIATRLEPGVKLAQFTVQRRVQTGVLEQFPGGLDQLGGGYVAAFGNNSLLIHLI